MVNKIWNLRRLERVFDGWSFDQSYILYLAIRETIITPDHLVWFPTKQITTRRKSLRNIFEVLELRGSGATNIQRILLSIK